MIMMNWRIEKRKDFGKLTGQPMMNRMNPGFSLQVNEVTSKLELLG